MKLLREPTSNLKDKFLVVIFALSIAWFAPENRSLLGSSGGGYASEQV